jgi:hypothetical protein
MEPTLPQTYMNTRKPTRPKKSLIRLHWESVQQNWQLWLLVLLVGGSLLGGLWLTKGSLIRTAEIPTWPTTSAQIKAIAVTQKNPIDPLDVKMELAYKVQDRQYVSSYQRSWRPTTTQQDPRQWQVGGELNIRYQPSNPQFISLFPEGP